MNLYLYCKPTDLSAEQNSTLKSAFKSVKILNTADFEPLMKDEEPKVLALDPDIVNWSFPNKIIAKIPNLKVICLQSTGFDWIDTAYCKEKGIIVTNIPHYATNSVAEKCIMMALALAKKFPLFEQEGKLGGVAFESDDLSKKYRGNVFITPHNAWYTKESLSKMFEIWVETIVSATKTPLNRVS